MFSSNDHRKDKMMRTLTEHASHKVIEKRRRDRINNCLLELSQTVPLAFAKQNTSKLEKAEILEMTVNYLRTIQTTEVGLRFDKGDWYSPDIWSDFMQHYQCGYSECMREVARFMTDVEGVNANDSRFTRLLTYLQTRFRPDFSVSGGLSFTHMLHRMTSVGNLLTAGAAQDGIPSPSRDVIGSNRCSARLLPYALPNCIQFPIGLSASRSQSSTGGTGLEHDISSFSLSNDVIVFDQNGWPRSEPVRGQGNGPIKRVKYQHRQK
ncbi:hairy and enhancer of split-related protein HELT-like [Liolophura sinensis]|uniref:hairy and enhancer of split-related protein HELT-like n=1 Tax=Liolophura sinensis TaxID=3198878 RepID=UPI0031591644